MQKTQQACNACRSLKVRCLPSSQPDVCAKCLRSGTTCVFADPPTRARIKQYAKSSARVARLESKLEELLTRVEEHDLMMLNSNKQDGLDVVDAPPHGPGFQALHEATPSAPKSRMLLNSAIITPQSSFLPDYSRTITNELFACGLSEQSMERSLLRFRSVSSYFPFVVIPANVSAMDLSYTQPYTLFAAISVTSIDTTLQPLLERQFRRVVLDEILMKGERTLDLLNGLLIYLAWYHFFYVPKREQFHQLLQVASGMVGDLGLNLSPSEAVSRRIGLRLSHYDKATVEHASHDEFFSSDARRAYLGWFYLSKKIHWLGAKACTLQFTPYMLRCATSLSHAMEYKSDFWLQSLLQLEIMADEAHEELKELVEAEHSPVSNARILAQLHRFQTRMKEWRETLQLTPLQGGEAARIFMLRGPSSLPIVEAELAYQYAYIHGYEMDLVKPLLQRKADESRTTPNVSSHMSRRLDILALCSQHVGEFFTTFLSISANEYGSLSFTQWSYFINAVLIGYRLCLGLAHLPEWDTNIARSIIKIEDILNTVSYNMEPFSDMDCSRSDLFSLMAPICEDVREKYQKLKCLSLGVSANDMSPVHKTDFPPRVPQPRRGCPGKQAWWRYTHSNGTTQIEDDDMLDFATMPDFSPAGHTFDDTFWTTWPPEGVGSEGDGF